MMIEILPPHADAAGGMTYRATLYGAADHRLDLQATISAPLRRRLAVAASRALAWAKNHVRLPHGGVGDLMRGEPPACGCDTAGETFRTAALRVADLLGDGASLEGVDPATLAWSFDEWDGSEPDLLSDLDVAVNDYLTAIHYGDDSMGAARRAAPRRLPSLIRPRPGTAAVLNVLRSAFAVVLGHAV